MTVDGKYVAYSKLNNNGAFPDFKAVAAAVSFFAPSPLPFPLSPSPSPHPLTPRTPLSLVSLSSQVAEYVKSGKAPADWKESN